MGFDIEAFLKQSIARRIQRIGWPWVSQYPAGEGIQGGFLVPESMLVTIEEAIAKETDPHRRAMLKAHTYSSKLVPVSYQLMQDSPTQTRLDLILRSPEEEEG